ncbi:LysR substrate-binding domain-containing protein [Pseudomonas synxantha]|uniref:LysR substrate-binding domain-containing protein n=1 Tax=Pseudomonas synxantha TaxID=47883 RepID=UPI0020FFF906|nr:LysR substrate-binding domain-containing protein [Pseudomonas synxantha]
METAGLRGVGIANLPTAVVAAEIADGRPIALLPEWQPAEGVITVVFASRRGLMPSVRSSIDFLGEAFDAADSVKSGS